MLISDAGRVKQVAEGLSRQGVGLSLDDFGTGFASLQQLRQLPLIEVKVDGSHVSAVVDSPGAAIVTTSTSSPRRWAWTWLPKDWRTSAPPTPWPR